VVDLRRVRLLLQRLGSDIAYLSDRAQSDRKAIARDVDRLAALKYVFITAIEGCIDVAQHLCASEAWGPPGTNADALRLLGRHGVLAQDLADRLGQAVGFRNVLVHGYAEVDDDLVVVQLDRVADLVDFSVQVSAWIESPGP